MFVLVTRILELLVFPPGGILLLLLVGLLARRRLPRFGSFLLWAGFLSLYLTSTPFVSNRLLQSLEIYPALTPGQIAEQREGAIVVLGGPDAYVDAPEYGHAPTAGAGQLERLRYAAQLQRQTGLPLMVVGGDALKIGLTGAQIMAPILIEELAVPVHFADGRSEHTFDNARYSAEVLRKRGIDRVVLVTHAWHMRRSAAAFRAEGLEVVPAPTRFTIPGPLERGVFSLLPQSHALMQVNQALHEWLGILWSRIRPQALSQEG